MNTVIIDEHEVVHRGVGEFLANSDFDVVAHCHTLRDYTQVMAADLMVDLILTEAIIDGNGLQRVIETIKKQIGNAKLIVFSEFDDLALIQQAKELGADGYILKTVSSQEFVHNLKEFCRQGNIWPGTQSKTAASIDWSSNYQTCAATQVAAD